MMNQTTTNRLNPMTTVMPHELLRVANLLQVDGQNKAYWDNVPVPIRPWGRLPAEEVFQVSVFAIPAVIIGIASMMLGHIGLLLSLPVAWFVGFIMDFILKKTIDAKYKRELKRDNGRYRATQWLAQQMGLTQRDITLPMIAKMAHDFIAVDAQKKAAEAQAEADRKEAIRNSVRRAPYNQTRKNWTAAGQTTTHVEPTYYEPAPEPEYSSAIDYNPSTGLPMSGNSGMDIAGNAFGTGHTI